MMKLIADLHIHSKYSRATSRDCVPEHLDQWARRKGIQLLGTGDFTHPAWRKELREKLQPAEDGLYVLKDAFRITDAAAPGGEQPRFLVTGEISSIYKKKDRVRKVHNLILLPNLEAAERLAVRLEAVGNLHSDGRPILGLDSRDLLEITLETCPDAMFIPAHIWTPHFSLFGAFSGFDTIEDCYEDLTPYIHAVETGLSSDPAMNWRLSALDRFQLVSNSDAHSPSKLGREANLLDTPLSYSDVVRALEGKAAGLLGTIEFFPEEGKYHYDGHRNCKQCLTPVDTEAVHGVCPVCGGKLTIGVLHRVEQLADRPEGFRPDNGLPYESLIPLPEVIAGSTGLTPISKKVEACYMALLHSLGSEFSILRDVPVEDIQAIAGPCVAEGVRRMREKLVDLSPGYDGEYGKIQLLDEKEMEDLSGQISFFGLTPKKKKAAKPKGLTQSGKAQPVLDPDAPGFVLNTAQQQAVMTEARSVAVIAGPGTGKTRVLVERIAHLILEKGVKPGDITAVTFTNRAAGEMRQRLEERIGKVKTSKVHVGTFHALCLEILSKDAPVTVLDETGARWVMRQAAETLSHKLSPQKLLRGISRIKNSGEAVPEDFQEAFAKYQAMLSDYGVLDFDDLLINVLHLWKTAKSTKTRSKPFTHLLVDEFQDINPIQYELIQVWGANSAGIFVIGDPDQSIYGFRGSDTKCFEQFLAAYPQTERIRLVDHYRSTPQILGCALPVIGNNPGESRMLEAKRQGGLPVRLLTSDDDFAEAVFVAKEINRMIGGIDMLDTEVLSRGRGGLGFSDVAVLYRTHRQAELLEKCLTIEGIPYVVAGRDELLSDPDVQGACAFFRGLWNPMDRVSRGLCLEYLKCAGETDAKWLELSARFQDRVGTEKPEILVSDWIQENRLEESVPMERFLHMAVCHTTLDSFLKTLALGGESDVTRSGTRSYRPDAVTLSTVHGAKGLEFPVVFLSGLKQGTFPLERPGMSGDLQEERRLFYVGMTRAIDEMLLLTSGNPSGFLGEIPACCIEEARTKKLKSASSGGKQLRFF